VGEETSEIRVDERLDALYRDPPSAFVAGRDRLAREARDAGRREEAERIKALRRPSAAAWLINVAALSAPDLLAAFAEASRRLGEVQGRALDGDEDAVAEWRAAAAREREASRAVVDAGRSLAVETGAKVSPRAVESAAETLQAAAGDPDLRDRALRGRLEREESAPTLGIPAGTTSRRTDTDTGSGSARRREAAAARREVERLRQELDDAIDREERMRESVERTSETLRHEKARLAEAKRETASLRRKVKTAERKAS
jgi:hypothetical protein